MPTDGARGVNHNLPPQPVERLPELSAGVRGDPAGVRGGRGPRGAAMSARRRQQQAKRGESGEARGDQFRDAAGSS